MTLLESGLRELERQGLTVPEGKRMVVGGVYSAEGYAVGVAWRSPGGRVEADAQVSRAIEEGRALRINGRIAF